MQKAKKILFVCNVDWFFISHRLVLAIAAKKEGYDVAVACMDTGRIEEIERSGIRTIPLRLERSGTNPLKELFSLRQFYRLYKTEKPDLLHHITLKPVVYGTIAARMLGISCLNAVSGLGYNLSETNKGLSKRVMVSLMKFGFRHKAMHCIFQNGDDLRAIMSYGILKKDEHVTMIKGAGVDLQEFKPVDKPEANSLNVILPARLLWDKGIKEFHLAAMSLKESYAETLNFYLVGMIDDGNKAGISKEELSTWIDEPYFNWMEYQTDMAKVYAYADIVVLPSYREGMPKSLLEACAAGKPIVTTDAIGCKECVDEGLNGFKVPVRDHHQLAEAISKLADSKELRIAMGLESRKKAEREFDLVSVVDKHLKLYKVL